MIENIKEFIKDFYKYTTTISICEAELFEKFGWLDSCKYWLYQDMVSDELVLKYIYEDMLYDLIFNQKGIKEQIINDLCSYEKNSREVEYIKEFYNKWKDMFDFEIDFEKLEG